MTATAEQIHAMAKNYLAGRVELDEFEDWILANTWNIHIGGDPNAVSLAHLIGGLLLDHSANAIQEDTVQGRLASAIRPFVRLSQASVDPIEIVYGKPPAKEKKIGIANRWLEIAAAVTA